MPWLEFEWKFNPQDNTAAVPFYSNNKAAVIRLLTLVLVADGHTVQQAVGDDDSFIVKCTLDIAGSGESVSVHASDTGIIIMLLHHWNDSLSDVFVKSSMSHKGRK